MRAERLPDPSSATEEIFLASSVTPRVCLCAVPLYLGVCLFVCLFVFAGGVVAGFAAPPPALCAHAQGDMDAAFQWLRERGSAKASDLGKREANEGLVAVVATDRCGAMVQVGCETDFSQRNADFQAFVGAVGRAAFDRVPPPPGLPGLPADVSVDALLRLDYTDDQVPGPARTRDDTPPFLLWRRRF